MKILKIFGLVAGIHVFALILIFANPGCSSSSKLTPVPSDTATPTAESSATVSLPMPSAPSPSDYSVSSPMSAPPPTFNPDAPATATGSSATIRFNPTRPGTAEANAIVAPRVADVTPATSYTVKSGDTLWELGKKFKVPYADIAAANNLKAGAALHAGQKLVIPKKAGAVTPVANTPTTKSGGAVGSPSTTTTPAATATVSNGMKHRVQPGETLGAIARTYGVKLTDIVMANHITDPAIVRAGMELVIPGWQATGGNSKAGTRPASSSAGSGSTPSSAAPVSDADRGPMTAPPSNDVPVIRVDDNPLSPAPKSN